VQKLSFLGCVLILVLVLVASCSPSTTTTTPSPTSKTPLPTSTATRTTTQTAPATTGPATGSPASDVPKYGGTLVKGYTTDVVGFDEVIGFHANPTVPMHLTNEELWGGDWAKGPAGTGQAEYDIGGADRWDLKAGVIAESWDFPQPGTSVWHIRHGIHWWLNQNSEASRLVAGRELTADDVVATLNMYIKTPRAYLASQPGLKDAVITSPEPWTVKITIDPLYAANAIMRFGDFASIVPPEVVKKYGDMSDWRTAEGTGPYMLTDYVSGSSVTLKRNPTYWDKDPVGPGKGNQLPYLDEVRFLIIPDASSMEAAFRTAKIDQTGADWETGPRLLKENSKLLSGKNTFDGGFNTHFNVEGNPLFKDIRVRRAMMMAVNWQSLVKDLFGGDAQINVWPVTYNKQYASLYLSLDDPDCPASVKELYKFDLEKAKSLMKEAGYPNGFKTTVICSNGTTVVDYYSVIKGMWSKLGIDLTIDARESAVHTSVWRGQQWTDLCYSSMGGLGTAFTGGNIYGDQSSNGSRVHDKVVEAAVKQMITAVSTQGQGAADKIHRELMKYVLDQAWAVPYPKAPGYRLWWPWVKNYHNEFSVGYWNEGNWSKWTWIDQDLKAKTLSR
jgi:peptide/nickel transport system substrate-binding protein